jgi:hypothetical protein
LSFIDTIAFVEYGDAQRVFQKWLETYANLVRLGVNADELFEFRNSLLHMTNLASRKVLAGKIDALTPYVGPELPRRDKCLNLLMLASVLFEAIQKWIITYNDTPDKILEFVQRYDLVVSDARMRLEAKPKAEM